MEEVTPTESPDKINPEQSKVEQTPEQKKVHYAEIYQKKITELVKSNEELARKVQEAEEKKLEESNQFKELYERERKKRELAEQAERKTKESYVHNMKLDAIKRAAIREGIHETAIDDLERYEHDQVQVEYTSLGSVNIIGVDEYMANLKQNKGYLFKKATAPKVNNNAPGVNTTFSTADLLKLEKEDPVKYRTLYKEMLDKKRNSK